MGALAIAGCAPAPAGIPPRTASIQGVWQIVEVKRLAMPPSGDFRMRIENGRLSARFGCNYLSGPYRQVGNVLHAGPINSTRMACSELAATIERDAGLILAQPVGISWTSRDHVQLTNRGGGIKLSRVH